MKDLGYVELFQSIFLDDWKIKLVALVVAIGLWLSVGGLRTPVSKRISNVPLNLSYSSDLEITNSPITEVDLIVTGNKNVLEKLRREDLVVLVDLSDVKAGERTITLAPETVNIELPSGVRIQEILPSKIVVKFEKLIEKEVTVKPETEGNLAKDFEVYNYQVFPAKVHVRGPESYVQALEYISTEKISLENRKESFTANQVELNIINPRIRVFETFVNVTFTIGEKRVEKTLHFPDYERKRVISITLLAPKSVLEKIKQQDLKLLEEERNGEPLIDLPEEFKHKVEIKKIKISSL
jgi:YbbR domain-containing protein